MGIVAFSPNPISLYFWHLIFTCSLDILFWGKRSIIESFVNFQEYLD